MRKFGFDIVVVRDCTAAFEYGPTAKGEWCKRVTIHLIEEDYGSSTTLSDLDLIRK